jgi:hypothetical protein
MIGTLTEAFLHCLADQRRLAKGEALSIGPGHGLSIWINENAIRTKMTMAARNSGKNFAEILSMIPALAEYCARKNIGAEKIPNELFKFIVYASKTSQNAPQALKRPSQGQRPKAPKKVSQRKDIERLWKAAIHGQDEEAKKTKFIDYALLDEIYEGLEQRYSLAQLKSLRKAWPELRQGIDWGDVLTWVDARYDDPTIDSFLRYFTNLANIMFKRGTICEAEFRELGKGYQGLTYPHDEIRIKAVLAAKKKPEPEPPKKRPMTKEERIKKFESLGWYRDNFGKMRHPDWN